METKTTTPVIFYGKTVKTNLTNMMQYVKVLPEQLINEAITEGLEITGPQIWQYTGMDGLHETEFDLTIAVPVKNNKQNKTNTLQPIKCISYEHIGSWNNFKQSYEYIMKYIAENKLIPTGLSREIYHMVDFENPENNLTEIQIEIN